jgi:hypothetical protein
VTSGPIPSPGMTASRTVWVCCVWDWDTRATLVVVRTLTAVVSQVESGLDAGQGLLVLLAVPSGAPLGVHVVHRFHLHEVSWWCGGLVLVGAASATGYVGAGARLSAASGGGSSPDAGHAVDEGETRRRRDVGVSLAAEDLRKTGDSENALPTTAARWPY